MNRHIFTIVKATIWKFATKTAELRNAARMVSAIDQRNELQSMLMMSWRWTYSMFPAYSAEAKAPVVQDRLD